MEVTPLPRKKAASLPFQPPFELGTCHNFSITDLLCLRAANKSSMCEIPVVRAGLHHQGSVRYCSALADEKPMVSGREEDCTTCCVLIISRNSGKDISLTWPDTSLRANCPAALF